MSKNDHYTLVIARSGKSPSPWGWEIYRNERPLPARLLSNGFKSEYTATLSGNAALREFLSTLAHEESRPDCS